MTRNQGIGSWLHANLGMALSITALVGGAIGAIVNGTVRITNYDYRLATLEAAASPRVDRVTQLEKGLQTLIEARITGASVDAQLAERLGVLESQVKFLAEAEHDAMLERLKHR